MGFINSKAVLPYRKFYGQIFSERFQSMAGLFYMIAMLTWFFLSMSWDAIEIAGKQSCFTGQSSR